MGILQQKIDGLRKGKSDLEREVFAKSTQYIIAAFGLVAGLAWNEAIKALIEYFFPLDKNSLLAKFLYAIVITLFTVIITWYVVTAFKKEEKK